MQVFRDRAEAGRALATRLEHHRGADALVLGLPRGGVPVAYEVARHLGAPLDVFLVRKLGVPGHRELAMGALASGGVVVTNADVLEALDIPAAAIERVVQEESGELARRERLYRGERAQPRVQDRVVILVDDGLATGATMRAAAAALRKLDPARLVVAAPVGAPDSCQELGELADEVVCVLQPQPFHAVGLWYEDFAQTTDDEVRELLELAAERQRNASVHPYITG